MVSSHDAEFFEEARQQLQGIPEGSSDRSRRKEGVRHR
jgi:hypothetical protein